ncbi:MAG: HAD family hydrolase [Candidatus Methanomethylophilaceae archaeon]|nr:HAD family hydrolase [Candidatus Methanomethylophilaceae archaeon]
MRGYSLYIFDFDNTLFDTSAGIKEILRHALPSVGVEYDDSMFPCFVGLTMEQVFDGFVKDESKRETFYEEFMKVVRSDVYLSAVPFPETEKVLRELKARGKHVAIASGKQRRKIERLMKMHGMGGIAETIVGYHDTRRHKPCPDPILLAMSRFDVRPRDCVYVGDSPQDPVAAKAAKIDSVIVRRSDGLAPDGIPCTWRIESLEELLDVPGN